jgi:hypothetical protein
VTPPPDSGPDAPTGGRPEEEPIKFQDLYRQLMSGDEDVRLRAVALVEALTPPTALRPLMRSYLHYGDRRSLEALAVFGDKLTLLAGSRVYQQSLGSTERARLMDVLGASGDPGALGVLREVVGDLDPRVHVAACAAIARLGELEGVELLDQALDGTDGDARLAALRAVHELEHPALKPLAERHVERYLAAGGAVPKNVEVALPMLLDPEHDVPELVAAHVAGSPRTLTIVIGPEMASIAEEYREVFERELIGHRLFFTTDRHTPGEQFDLLAAARDAAAADPKSAVALVGVLPSPGGLYPPPHFLVGADRPSYTARIVFVGQQDFNVVMEWWYYIEDKSEVPTDFEVVLTALTLGGDRLTEEEWITYTMADEYRREEFARALLAHRAVVGDALEGRSWLF